MLSCIQRRLYRDGYDYCDLLDECGARGWRVLLELDDDDFTIIVDDGARQLDGRYAPTLLTRHTAAPWSPGARDRSARIVRARLEIAGHIREPNGV